MRPNNAISAFAFEAKYILDGALERIIIFQVKFVGFDETTIMFKVFDIITKTLLFISELLDDIIDQLYLYEYLDYE